MSAVRTERLLNLLGLLLNAKRPVTLREIRALEEFSAYRSCDPKTGERAFERDKAALVALGVPLRWVAPQTDDEEGLGGYRVDTQHYYLAEVELSPQERALLSIAGAAAATLEGYLGHKAVRRALAKLGFDADADGAASVPEQGRSALAHAPLAVGTDIARLAEHLDVLHQALATRRRVDVQYPGGTDACATAPSVRRLDPLGLYYRQGVWYLVGFCHLRRARRTFHMGRVTQIALCSKPQAFTDPSDFDIRKAARMRPWQYPKAAAQRVWVRLAERVVPAVTEIFGADIAVHKDAHGPYVCIEVSHSEGFLSAIMPLGDAAEVVAPAAMRALVAQTYDALASRYARLRAAS